MDQPLPGAVLGHYKIIRRLGAGGMGVVYEAEDLKLGRHVALKLLSGAGDPATLDRFWREARAVSALNHPGICTLYEINETEQQPFLVMELLEGQSLERHQGSAVPPNRLIELGIQIADALEAAHHKGILHRDVKPANIFITKTGQVKILDFGLARFEETSSEITDNGLPARHMITQPGSTLGTIAYMSPEQARGEVLDARSDVFSLGVVLYEMATGTHPFNGATTAIVFDKLLNYVPLTPALLNTELPPQLVSILNKAVEKNRDLRYQSAAELRTDLWRLQRSTAGEPPSPLALAPFPAPQYEGTSRVSEGGVAVATAPAATAVSAERAPNPLTAFDSAPAIPSVVAALRQAAAPEPAKPPTKRPVLPLSLPASLPLSPKRIRQGLVAVAILAVVVIAAVALRPRHHQQPPGASAPAPAPAPTQTAAVTAPAPESTPAPATTAPPTRAVVTKPAPPREATKPSAAHVTTQNATVTPAPSATSSPAQLAQSSPATSASTPPAQNSTAAAPATPKPNPAQPAAPPPAASTPAFATIRFAARHEHAFPYLDGRSCSGTLELSPTRLVFDSDVHPISLTRDDVTAVESNGVVDTAGKRYRFQIEGMSNRQVHDLLAKWFSAAEPRQPSASN